MHSTNFRKIGVLPNTENYNNFDSTDSSLSKSLLLFQRCGVIRRDPPLSERYIFSMLRLSKIFSGAPFGNFAPIKCGPLFSGLETIRPNFVSFSETEIL